MSKCNIHLAQSDTAQTNEDTSIAISVLKNDHGGNAKHLYSLDQTGTERCVTTATTPLGATITMNDDGSITYDPTQAFQLQALMEGQALDDTFRYTMQVGNGVTSSANVTVHVAGENDVAKNILGEVPAYNWYHGCGPTASASVLGYYDLHGYPQLFDAAGWDAIRLTQNVQDQISSPEHNAKYDFADDPMLPVPPPTSLADFMHTSMDPLAFGFTYVADLVSGIQQYAAYRGEPLSTWFENIDSSNEGTEWTKVTNEVLGGHPMVFIVDSDGDGSLDHSIPVFGFEQHADASEWFAAYTTWSEDETVNWFEFRPMAQGTPWGVAGITFVEPQTANSPLHMSNGDGLGMVFQGFGDLSQTSGIG